MTDRLSYLLDAYLENRLTDGEAGELRDLLRASAEARQLFWEYVEQHTLIEDILGECRGRDLALAELDNTAVTTAPVTGSVPVRAGGAGHFRDWAVNLAALAVSLLLLGLGLWRGPDVRPLPISGHPALGTVQLLAGIVEVVDPSGQKRPVTASTPLFEGQVIHVGDEDSRAEVRFADGTQITLGSGTAAWFPTSTGGKGKRLHIDKGAAKVQAHAAQSPLVVTTDHVRILASWTNFRLYREPKASRVELEEGKVHLESPTGANAVELAEGSYVVATDEPEPMVPQQLALTHCPLRHTFVHGGDAACFSPDGSRLIASHHSRGWKAWDTLDGSLLAKAPGIGQWSSGLAVTSKTDTVLALGKSGAAMFWKIGQLKPARTGLQEKGVRCAAVSGDGRWLAQGTSDGMVALWETNPDTGSISLRKSLLLKPSRVALASFGPHLAVSQWSGEIQVFDVKTGNRVAQYKLKRTPTPLALSADSNLLAAYANTEGLILFNRHTDARFTLWPGEGARIGCLEFSADGRVLFAGLEDGTVRAWSTADGKSLLVLDTGNRNVNKVTATTDLTLLATVGDSDCVKIWECKLPLPGPPGGGAN